MKILASLFTTVIALAVIVLIFEYTGFYAQSFKVFFILPAGAGFAGAFCASGYYFVATKMKKEPSRPMLICSMIGLLGFVLLYVSMYSTSYVDSDNKVNHMFRGEHISNFTYEDSNEPVNFKSYMISDINSREMSLFVGAGKKSTRVAMPVGSIEINSTLNIILFVVEGLGFIIGGWVVGSNVISFFEAKRKKQEEQAEQEEQALNISG
ncbi:hypothetical protein [Paenibacillus sp. NEAU-GSW1]|uniref:hypothetical protein n=1 Tax=Paenibacillus sp. NEAU-GSW1 TaxID=2682486 RepID=UPI0012E23D4E|nr:hypothetical protein [Paenibacillus sp. NEAU-GSW1]MUT67623.1 hypothetical protein [Paenibacillus sp. NEAU-GSW1]